MATTRRRLLKVSGFVLAAAGAFWFVSIQTQDRRIAENDRIASGAIRRIATAEWDFREHDRDANGIQDFWTADVAGLHSFGVLPKEFADADLHPRTPRPGGPVPYHGYYYFVMTDDDSTDPSEPYAQITDSKSGKVHHRTKYAFCAYPAVPGVSGNYVYIVNESYSGYSRSVKEYPLSRRWPKDEGGLNWNRCLGGG